MNKNRKESRVNIISTYDLFDESTIDDVITQLISLKCKISDGHTHVFEYDSWENELSLHTWRYETDAEIAEREQKDHQKEQKLADAKQAHELSEFARLKEKYETNNN